jgi:hypothetical protein
MKHVFVLALLMAWLPAAHALAEDPPAKTDQSAEAAFNEQVLPILQQHCYKCHSHASRKAKGGLVLDSKSGWATGGDSGPAVVPGKPDESLLISAVRYQDLEMPPTGKLPEALVDRLERWVADGAHDPRVTELAQSDEGVDFKAGRKHWAFRPLARKSPPRVRDSRWSRAAVDRFILSALEKQGLKPIEDTDPYTWLRRVTFDLTGLPPTVDAIREFEADPSAEGRERVVDRLLSSRAFGERWARHWLDLVGYADQIGTSNNVFAQHAWRYRDYVIDSFNSDKPFDRFIREQIAGDLLPHDSVEERAANLVATGFLVLGDIEIVEADKAKLLVDIVDQQLAKVSRAFLGLTIDCARCHDHKFDPIAQTDYYAMAGFFHGTSTIWKTKRGVWSDVNVNDLPETETQQQERVESQRLHAEKLAGMKTEREQAQQRVKALDEQLKNSELSKEERDKLTAERAKANGRIGPLNRGIPHAVFFTPTVPRAHGVWDVEQPTNMKITIRGNPRALGDEVPRGFPRVVSDERPLIPPGESGREQLADWVTGDENPLTARVTVNRVWQKLFGEGLVRSVDYFGLPGDTPSHPELLDYLARQFIRSGWSQKKLIRSLVLSRTYRLDSVHDDRASQVDPENRLLWRMNRFRLDAEALRDAMIFVSGKLKSSSGGPAMPLEFPENVNNVDPSNVNPASFGFARWRPGQEFERTVYLPIIRHEGQPGPAALRNVFDFPQPSQFTGQRSITAVPTQALFLMNSNVVRQQASALATRMKEASTDDTERLELLWLTLLNRPITGPEQQEATAFLEEAGEDAWIELCHAMLASNEFLMRL